MAQDGGEEVVVCGQGVEGAVEEEESDEGVEDEGDEELCGCWVGLVWGGRGVVLKGETETDDLFLVVWGMAVDVDEVDFGRVELGEERLDGCRGGGEGCWDRGRVAAHGGGGFGEGFGRAFGWFGCHFGRGR